MGIEREKKILKGTESLMWPGKGFRVLTVMLNFHSVILVSVSFPPCKYELLEGRTEPYISLYALLLSLCLPQKLFSRVNY